MKIGVVELPQAQQLMLVLHAPQDYAKALLLVLIGLLAYACSMVCWIVVLNYLPLNRAYPLLSLSYGLVYLGAASLPWFHEQITLTRSIGVVLIIAGIVVMNWRRSSNG